MTSKNSKKFKTLFLKAEYLESELDLVEEDFSELSSEFLKAINKRVNYRKKDNDFGLKYANKTLTDNLQEGASNISEGDPEVDKEDLSANFKKLYRKVMFIVHPDKLETMDDCSEKSRLTDLASVATKSAREKDWYLLASVAVKLGVETDEVSDEQIDGINSSCEKMEGKITVIKASFPWVWGNSSEEERESLLDSFIHMKYGI